MGSKRPGFSMLGTKTAETQYRQDFQRTYIYNIKTLLFFYKNLQEIGDIENPELMNFKPVIG